MRLAARAQIAGPQRDRSPGRRSQRASTSARACLCLGVAALLSGIGALACAAWIPVKAHAAQWLIAHAWSRALEGAVDARPWPWADTRPVARLLFVERAHGTAQGSSLVVLSGASGRNLAFAPAHDPASVLPGEPGNSVIAGHRDTHFARLARVARGDSIVIERADGRRIRFVVDGIAIVDSRTTRIALDAPDARLTLTTCYPFAVLDPGGAMRYVVTARARARPAGSPRRRASLAPGARTATRRVLQRPCNQRLIDESITEPRHPWTDAIC